MTALVSIHQLAGGEETQQHTLVWLRDHRCWLVSSQVSSHPIIKICIDSMNTANKGKKETHTLVWLRDHRCGLQYYIIPLKTFISTHKIAKWTEQTKEKRITHS